jgi:hypothetical protein
MKAHVAGIYFKCFICFRGMLQVFHMDVSKVYRDVAHVAMIVHVCCKRLFQMFHLFFQRNVASVSYEYFKSISGCCTCCNGCTRMLQASVLNISSVFTDICCKCVCLDVAYFHTYVGSVLSRMLHMFFSGFLKVF